jgi:pimeloyl-ACP methyl ester carboxylesterase
MRPITNAHGERLDVAFHAGRAGDARLVVIAHGVTSHKDRPWLIALSTALSAAGIASLRVSFAGNGSSEGRYADATISKEVGDLGSVLDALADRVVIYAGHSMGAAVGVLRAARDPRIRALVSLAGMVHVGAFMRAQFGHLRPGADCMLGKPQCPLTQAFLDDAFALGDVLPAAAKLPVPWLLVHGTADELVPLQDARDAQATNPRVTQLVAIDGADHRFTGHLAGMNAAVLAWLASAPLSAAALAGDRRDRPRVEL